MKTILNDYTIDDFLKLRPIIYEYCVNLTQKKTTTSWFRDLADADDLYQEVFLYVYDNYFNKPKESYSKGKFVQIMKNITFWTYKRRFTRPGAKILISLHRIDDTPKSLFLFDITRYEEPLGYENFTNTIDFEYYTKGLKPLELKALELYLEGFSMIEIDTKCEKYRGFTEHILRVKLRKRLDKDIPKIKKPEKKVRTVKSVTLKIDDLEFVKSKVKNFDKVFIHNRFIRMYSLYLQGVSQKELSTEFDKSINQVRVEIFRINKRVREYAN